MTTILQLNTSIFGDGGASTKLADDFVSRWHERDGATVIRRDFAREPVPHLTAERFQAALQPAAERSDEQAREAALADELIDELMAADALVIALPMYNFNVPSALKAWFDHVARAGTTFRYTENGAEGLATGKKAYVFATRGGIYEGTDFDFQTPYVRQFLGFLGIGDVEF
ncbi:MAG: NAD(P)H-dependent oxidoreductase, partial [Pseudomonadales bacterium]|nr:NAD(P)H-dependent oxidoreductase [Pseudomonadales bacterium]